MSKLWLSDDELEAIHWKRVNETITLADVDRLLTHIEFIQREWTTESEAFRAVLVSQGVYQLTLPGFLVYEAAGGVVGVWRTDERGKRIHEDAG